MKLRLITPPSEEPVTLSEVKEYLRMDDDETAFDGVLMGLIVAAREYCETFQNRAFVTQTWEMSFDGYPTMPLRLPKAPLQDIVSVTYTDRTGAASVWPEENYFPDIDSDPGRLLLVYGKAWPGVELQPANGVRIRFVAGYGDPGAVPESVKVAMKIFVGHRFENPESEDVPAVVRNLLRPERVMPV